MGEWLDAWNAKRREQYANDGGKRRAYNQAWKDANREKVRERERLRMRKVRATDEGKRRSREDAKKYAKNNPDKVLEQQRRWRKNNPKYHTEWNYNNKLKNPKIYILRSAKNRAKEIGVEFTITEDDIDVPSHCPVLGVPFTRARGKSWLHYRGPSIDRIDNSKGYIPGNVRVVCWRVNRIKWDATLEEMERIVAYMRGEI